MRVMYHTLGVCLAVLVAAFGLHTSVPAGAQESDQPAAGIPGKAPRPYPFNGKLHAVDKEKKTITLLGKEKSRVLHVDPQTKIEKDRKPATLDDAVVGEMVGGQVRKTADGREVLVSLRIGVKPGKESKDEAIAGN